MRKTIFANTLIPLLFVWLVTLLTACGSLNSINSSQAPSDFVDLQDFFSASGENLAVDVRYAGFDNFLGAPVDGYEAEKIYMSMEAARALLRVQLSMQSRGLALKVFDAYRPQKAVDHFVRWAQDLEDVSMKAKYYPNVEKQHLFRDGYIAARSGHSRGSTVDLTLIRSSTGAELDMGSGWDFFDPLSWPSSTAVNAEQKANRDLLRSSMIDQGFRPLAEEWWHFTLDNEPFSDRYFDFDIK
jgi:zinc D-Ala-D-Ala dipeptidase